MNNQEVHEEVSPSSKRLERWVMAVLIVFIGFGITFAWMERRSADDMAAIADTSMGVGALAAGGEGLAIGTIVGGWGAYVGHRIWNWVK